MTMEKIKNVEFMDNPVIKSTCAIPYQKSTRDKNERKSTVQTDSLTTGSANENIDNEIMEIDDDGDEPDAS
jgi:hypothetical protein